jgi:hypothetical protein
MQTQGMARSVLRLSHMKLLALAPLFSLALAASCAGDPDGAGHAEAVAAVDRWIAAHPGDWNVTVDDRDTSHRLAPFGETTCDANGLGHLRYSGSGVGLRLSFACAGLTNPTTESLRQAFRFATLDTLPHGLSLPDWRFEVLTPSSSFTAVVEVVALRDGRLELRIDTPLFAIRADDARQECQPPADGTQRPECFVQRELHSHIKLHVTVPFDPTRT